MRGDNAAKVKAIFQMDQLEAKLADVLEHTELLLLTEMIVRLVKVDGLVQTGEDQDVDEELWAVVSTAGLLAIGREISRRTPDAQS